MSNNCPTPHINAVPEDFAKTVLMPGDPLRSKYIAENYLENAKLVNNVRGIQGYTGTYKGVPVSVMASGMGMPSMGVYSYELFNFFDVDNIIRIGSAGGMGLPVSTIVAAIGACTTSSYAFHHELPGTFAPVADFGLLRAVVDTAEEKGVDLKVGNVVSSDVFYKDDHMGYVAKWQKMGVIAEEMEAAALYLNAARAGKKGLCVCTITDDMLTGEGIDSMDRQTKLDEMITLVLDMVVKINEK